MQNVFSGAARILGSFSRVVKHKWNTSRTLLLIRGRSLLQPIPVASNLQQLVIVDPSLDGFLGHHYEYDISTARAAISAGYTPIILCNHYLSPVIGNDPLLAKTFHMNMWQTSPHAGNWTNEDLLFCNRSFYVDLVRGLANLNLKDDTIIFGHMITAKQLLGWAWFLESLPTETTYKIVLLLRYEPSVYTGALADQAFRILEQFALRGSLRLCSDSAKLAKTFATVTALPVEVFAIPHTKQVPDTMVTGMVRAAMDENRPIRFICLGNPRQDKGILDFLEAIQLVNSSAHGNRCEFIVQANDPGHGTQPHLSNFMQNAPQNARFITELMNPDDYFAALFSADVVILPYWKSVYEFRTSGVFVEAVCAGKIVVCSKNTWMADELGSVGSGLLCEEQNPASLAKAIVSCLENFDDLQAKAVEAAPKYSALHNAHQLVQNIFNPITIPE